MKTKISNLFEQIKDYRIEDELMSQDLIEEWINQFHEEDREFILEETTHLMKHRYLSLENAKLLIKNRIEFLYEKHNFATPQDFLEEVRIIDHQPEGKSQKILLNLLYEVCDEHFNFDLSNHFNIKAKYYLYFDDVLCTGDTLYKGLANNTETSKGFFFEKNVDGKTNLEVFIENDAKLLLSFFCLHKKNIYKVISRLRHGLKYSLNIYYSWNSGLEIDNTLEDNCKFNFFILSESNKSDKVEECENQIKNKLNTSNYYKEEDFYYRPDDIPDEEKLYSSKENRERYEKIISEICIDIYNGSEGLLDNARARPLGYGLRLENSLGFGTLFFTWRNAPYNTPLIFWYGHHGWTPLFRRNYIEY
ncbi:phosphoribosyltransferase-like protein [Chryseobacterium sp. 22458]|uniref:phosphoribosyltransferase-like protein n=1 Tax=Chryseobacterium sp. 22458 TaxID=3453921 RepID=UPI003F83FE81